MSAIRLIRYSLAYLAYLIISVVFLLEIIFRLLPTTSPVDLQIISDRTDVLKFYPNQTGVFPYSILQINCQQFQHQVIYC